MRIYRWALALVLLVGQGCVDGEPVGPLLSCSEVVPDTLVLPDTLSLPARIPLPDSLLRGVCYDVEVAP